MQTTKYPIPQHEYVQLFKINTKEVLVLLWINKVPSFAGGPKARIALENRFQ